MYISFWLNYCATQCTIPIVDWTRITFFLLKGFKSQYSLNVSWLHFITFLRVKRRNISKRKSACMQIRSATTNTTTKQSNKCICAPFPIPQSIVVISVCAYYCTAIACRELTLRTNSISMALCFEINYSIHKSEPKQIEISTYRTHRLLCTENQNCACNEHFCWFSFLPSFPEYFFSTWISILFHWFSSRQTDRQTDRQHFETGHITVSSKCLSHQMLDRCTKGYSSAHNN